MLGILISVDTMDLVSGHQWGGPHGLSCCRLRWPDLSKPSIDPVEIGPFINHIRPHLLNLLRW